MIKIKGVTKKYGARAAIKDLSFEVQKGEVVGFLGPNGAGKTTTMKIITGYMVPTEGEVFIDGEDILESPLKTKKKLGYLPEMPPLYGDMYVEAYLKYVANLKQVAKDQVSSQVDSVIKQVGLEQVRHRLIQNLSKGFRQRTGLAQALVGDPEILILDEPTVGLDPSQVLEIRKLISDLRGQHTIILSTHILSEVQASCDRIIIIKEGQMVAQESLNSLREKQSQSRRRIGLRVREISKKLLDTLRAIPGIEEVTVSPNNSALIISLLEGKDLNEQVAKAVIAEGAGLIELSESFSLEDVFLDLTSKQQGQGK